MSSLIFDKTKLSYIQYFTGTLKLALVDTSQNDILENSHSFLVAKGATMGSSLSPQYKHWEILCIAPGDLANDS